PVQLVEPPSHCSWRTHLARGEYEGLLEFWGPKEMHRQEVIWELAETEKSFVQSMCSLQKIFALPLKTPEGRWIDGVPCSVARLFDWLEDILQLHSKISNALQRARNQQTQDSHPSRVILHVADCVLRYVPRLEVHQPYLVRFESVTAMIEEMLHSEDSVFGQFVNM
ncbi:Dbl homology domain-containing protein, partial [Violaceomyces palustris]